MTSILTFIFAFIPAFFARRCSSARFIPSSSVKSSILLSNWYLHKEIQFNFAKICILTSRRQRQQQREKAMYTELAVEGFKRPATWSVNGWFAVDRIIGDVWLVSYLTDGFCKSVVRSSALKRWFLYIFSNVGPGPGRMGRVLWLIMLGLLFDKPHKSSLEKKNINNLMFIIIKPKLAKQSVTLTAHFRCLRNWAPGHPTCVRRGCALLRHSFAALTRVGDDADKSCRHPLLDVYKQNKQKLTCHWYENCARIKKLALNSEHLWSKKFISRQSFLRGSLHHSSQCLPSWVAASLRWPEQPSEYLVMLPQ